MPPDARRELEAGISALGEKSTKGVEAAVSHLESAVRGFDQCSDRVEWAIAQLNLGIALTQRASGSRRRNVERAIECLRIGMEVLDEFDFPSERVHAQMELGNAYMRRLEGRMGDNLERALSHLESAAAGFEQLGLRSDAGMALTSLGLAYMARLRDERSDNVEKAIFYYDRALTHLDDPGARADALINLANAFLERSAHPWQQNIEFAIDQLTRARKIAEREPLQERLAVIENNLGYAYWRRGKGQRRWNITESIRHFRAAQASSPSDTDLYFALAEAGLGHATSALAELEESHDLLLAAVDHYEKAGRLLSKDNAPLEWAGVYNALGQTLAQTDPLTPDVTDAALTALARAAEIYRTYSVLVEHRRTLTNIARLHLTLEHWDDALDACLRGVETGEAALGTSFTELGRREAAGAMSGLFSMAAYCELRRERLFSALEILDRGRARVLGEALQLSGALREKLPPHLSERLKSAATAVAALQAPGGPATTGMLRVAWEELRAVIADVRAHDPNLLPVGMSANVIRSLIPAGGVLIAIVVTNAGGAAIIVPGGTDSAKLFHVDLPELTEAIVDAWLNGDATRPGWIRAYRSHRESGNASAQEGWRDTLHDLTEAMWRYCMGPVDAELRRLGIDAYAPVVIAAPGRLSVLPIHAAYRVFDGEERPFSADWSVSYYPGGAVAAAVARRQTTRTVDARSLLAVADPDDSLPFAALEVAQIQGHFPTESRRVLSDGEATVEAVLASASRCDYVHFACHAAFDWVDPTASGLRLAGGQLLTVADVYAKMQLHGETLVVLSACESGIIDLDLAPDEYVGFPAAFFDAGAHAVLSTLWAVNDASTAVVVSMFYDLLINQGLSAATALRVATERVRTSTVAELRLLDWWQPAYDRSAQSIDPGHANEDRQDGSVKPYADARFWAPFVVTSTMQ